MRLPNGDRADLGTKLEDYVLTLVTERGGIRHGFLNRRLVLR